MINRRTLLEKRDYSDVSTGEAIEAVHPGVILRDEFLVPLGITPHALAIALRVPAPRVNDVVRGKRAISSETALRLARYFKMSAAFWTNLQASYDLRVAAAADGERIELEVVPLPDERRELLALEELARA
jgi:antitoxin HigA-1